jgi:LysM repeat protein
VNDEDMTGGETYNDDFWGGTPDWTDAPQRPRRAKRSGDVTGAIKGLWSSAMSAGADATREHRVLDATAAMPADDLAVGPQMFDDLDDFADFHGDFLAVDRAERITQSREESHDAIDPTGDPTGDPVGDSTRDPSGQVPVIDVFDEDVLAAVAPVSMSERATRRRGTGGLDPLLVRVGAVAIATTLLVPLAIGLSSGGESNDTISSATAAATATAAAPTDDTTSTNDTTPLAAGSVTTDATSTPVGLDPESLPPAVPVDTDASEASTPDSSNESSDSSTDFSTDLVAASATSESDSSGGTTSGSEATETETAGSEAVRSDSTEADGVDQAATAGDGAERVSGCAVDYTVVAGDFWLRLADAADVALAELLEANDASVDTPLYPGSEICLPAGATTPAPPAATSQPAATAPPATAAPTTVPTRSERATPEPSANAPTTTERTTAPDSTPNTDATPDEVEQIIRDVWPDELEEKALQIAFRESRFVPTAKNYCCYGLFQMYWEVHKSWLADIGVTDDQQLFDPTTNARAAYALYQRSGGWGPWSQTDY